jgi:hypothetical protein
MEGLGLQEEKTYDLVDAEEELAVDDVALPGLGAVQREPTQHLPAECAR